LEVVKKFLKRTPFSGIDEQDINIVVPFLQVSKLILTRALRIHEFEMKDVPCGGRIFYMSKMLNVEPLLVAKYFATHMFIFGGPFEQFKENLETLIKYKIGELKHER
jgi:hypothetical protein